MNLQELIKNERILSEHVGRIETAINQAQWSIDNCKEFMIIRVSTENRDVFTEIEPQVLIEALNKQLNDQKSKLSPIKAKLEAIELMLAS